MKTYTYTFNCTFICANTGEEKQVKKDYAASNYLDARKGLRKYFEANKTVKQLLELEDITLQNCFKGLSK